MSVDSTLSAASVTEVLQERVLSGHWQPGQRVATEKELAEELGVSPATVQRSMKELEKAGLIWGRRGSGRFVSEQALDRQTRQITLVIAEPGHMFHPALVTIGRGVSQIAEQRGYHLKYWAIHAGANNFDASSSPAWLRLLQAERTDGLIVATQRIHPEALEQASSRLPVVWLHPIARLPRLTSVALDYLGGSFQAARHLIELGHRRVALLTTPPIDPVAQPQVDGARLALMEQVQRGKGRLDILRAPNADVEAGREIARQWVNQPADQRATAVIAGSDELAIGFYETITRAGLAVPRDVSLVGWNDFITREQIPIEMTSVRVRYEEAGRRSARQLIRMLESPEDALPEPDLVECELIPRASTARPGSK